MHSTPNTTSDCYAAELGGCSGKISREHYFSESIWHLLAGNDSLTAEGFTWIPDGESKKLSPNALASKILCSAHNSQLHRFDTEALRFFRALRYESSDLITQIDGYLLERWFLKLLIGCSLVNRAQKTKHWTPPKAWLEVLFEAKEIPNDCGLMIPISGRKLRGVYNGADIQIHYKDPQLINPAGVFVRLGWMAAYFCMVPNVGPDDFSYSFRPKEISIAYPDKRKTIELPWRGLPAVFTGPVPQHAN